MTNFHLSVYAKRFLSINKIICLLIIFFTSILTVYSDNRSDATTLREKCEKESKVLEVAVKNFGSKKDLSDFSKGIKLMKIGKVKIIQSKYVDAKVKYNEYLKLQYQIYKSLGSKYIERTEKIKDDIAVELVDFIDEGKVEKYFRLANQHLVDAKSAMKRNYFKQVIDECRTAKKYAISVYKLVGKAVPDKYKKDMNDINRKIN